MKSNYNLKLSIESVDKYEKARDDLMKAKISFEELTVEQKKRLIKELSGVEDLSEIFDWLQKKFG